MSGNNETGRTLVEIPPTMTVRMEITIATIGRLMKNLDISGAAVFGVAGHGVRHDVRGVYTDRNYGTYRTHKLGGVGCARLFLCPRKAATVSTIQKPAGIMKMASRLAASRRGA